MMVQAQLDEPQSLYAFWVSSCSRSAGTSFEFAKMENLAGSYLLVYLGPCQSYHGGSVGPSDGNKWATRLAALVAACVALAVRDVGLVVVNLHVLETAVGLASQPCSGEGDLTMVAEQLT